jgi:hypothetical protein
MASLIEKNREFAIKQAATNPTQAPFAPRDRRRTSSPPASDRGAANLTNAETSPPLQPAAASAPRNRAPRAAQPRPLPAATTPKLVTREQLSAGAQTGPRNLSPLAAALNDLPLYPSEAEVAAAVLGPGRVREWKALAVLLEREGLPSIDPVMGGRSWQAVKQFFRIRDGLDAKAPGQPLVSDRVRCVPLVPDGKESPRYAAKKEPVSGRRQAYST